MPKKRRSRGRGNGQRDWAEVAAGHEQERLAASAPPPPPPRAIQPPPPSAPAGPPPAAAGARRLGRGRLLAVGGLGVTAGGAGLYALHRSRRRKAAVGKQWITLDGEVVELRKAAPIALPVPSSRPVRALLPTGRHVSHENKYKHVSISPRRRPTSVHRRYGGVGKGVSLSTTPGRLVPVRRKPPKPSPRETLGKAEGLFWGPDTPALSHYGHYPVFKAESRQDKQKRITRDIAGYGHGGMALGSLVGAAPLVGGLTAGARSKEHEKELGRDRSRYGWRYGLGSTGGILAGGAAGGVASARMNPKMQMAAGLAGGLAGGAGGGHLAVRGGVRRDLERNRRRNR